MAVTEELNLNVLGLVQETLNEDSTIAKGRLGFGCGTLEGVLEILLLPDDTHTTSATTESSLDDDREAVLVGEALDLLEFLDGARSTGNHRNFTLHGKLTCRDLVTKAVDGLGGGANPNQTSFFHLFREFVVLTEEAITGVDHLDVC